MVSDSQISDQLLIVHDKAQYIPYWIAPLLMKLRAFLVDTGWYVTLQILLSIRLLGMDWPLSLPKLANPIFLAFHCQTGIKIPRNLYSPERRLWLMSICQNVLTRLNQHKPSGPSLTTVLLYYIYSTIVRSCRGR